MKILGIDTSTKFLCLAVCRGDKIYEYNLETGTKLSGIITSTIKRVIGALGWKMADIDIFAAGVGPGSFTGLRIGMATVKGLAFSLNRPVVGVSSLDLLAANAPQGSAPVIPVMDARRNLVYAAVYRNNKGRLSRIGPYMLLSIDELLKKVNKEKAVFLGDGINIYRSVIASKIKNCVLLDKDYWYPAGRNIIKLAAEKITAGKKTDAFKIQPAYLYPHACQVRNV